MSNESPLKALKTFSIKTEEETVARFKQLRESVGIATDGQYLTELLDRYEQPQRVADRTKELEVHISSLEAALDEVKLERDTQRQRIAELEKSLAEAQSQANDNAQQADRLQLEHEKQLQELQLGEHQAVVSFTPDNLRVLDLVCARESKRRGQQWSRSHVINYFINARFVRGLLNGDLQSIPDSELRRLGVSLKSPGKEDFDL